MYKPAGNSTKLDGYTWKIQYGDGSGASGDVYKDTVAVGSITARGQAVESAKQISEQFVQNRNNDGLLGLAFSSINTGILNLPFPSKTTPLLKLQFNPSLRQPSLIPSSPSWTLPFLSWP